MKPAHPSDPPPGWQVTEGRPMSPFAATGWAVGATLLWTLLVTITVTLRSGAENDLVNNFVCQLVATLGVVFGILRIHAPNDSIRDVFALRRTHLLFFPLAIGLGLAVQVPASTLYEALLRRWPDPQDADRLSQLYSEAGTPGRVLIGMVVVAFGPLLEEIFYRGALFTPLRRAGRLGDVVVITAVLFGLAHVTAQRIVPIVLVGLAMGLLRHASGSLLPSIAMHATFNAGPMWELARGRTASVENEPLPWATAAMSVGVALALAACTWLVGKRSTVAAHARERDRR